jgi:putative ABC transport system permease protein
MAVLKTLGFTGNVIFCLVIVEAVLLCLTAATLGLLLAKIAIPITTPAIEDYVLLLQTGWIDMLRGFGLAVIVAVVSSLYPAWRVRRLSIVDALSRR